MFCIFHSWKTVTHHLTRFEDLVTVRECSDCDKLSIEVNQERLERLSTLDIQTEARVVITMSDVASLSAENYPNEYDVEAAWKIIKAI